MTREQALRKVLACLRLAGSSNPNEAAAALRQANALMTKYGLTEADALASEIRDAEAPTRCRGTMLPKSLAVLANMVAGGYRCQIVVQAVQGFDCNLNLTGRTAVRFFGAGADAQVAAYAFTVLRRQLEADRAHHTRRIRKRANRDARGEAFALGWVRAVAALFPSSELPDGRAHAIDAAIAQRMGATTKEQGRQIGKPRAAHALDQVAGLIAGKGARLNPGLGENGQRRLESANA